MTVYLAIIVGTLAVAWATKRDECEDCGDQLKWCDPTRSDVPITRCFTCDGAHPAYVRDGYHHLFDYAHTEAP